MSAQAPANTLGQTQLNSQTVVATATDATTGETSLVAIPQTSRNGNRGAPTPPDQTVATANAPVPAQQLTQSLAIAEPSSSQTISATPAQTVIADAVAPSAPTIATQTSNTPSAAVLQGSDQATNGQNVTETAGQTLALAAPSDDEAATSLSNATAVQQAPAQVQEQPKASNNLLARLFQPRDNAARPKKTRSSTSRNGRDDDTIRIASAHDRGKPRVTSTRRSQTEAAVISSQARSSANRSAAALPGVKSNDEIFGIRPNKKTDDANTRVSPETRLASVGGLGLLSPNGLRVQHDKVQVACLKPGVIRLLKVVERHYRKKPIITSGYRSPNRNRRAGGAKNSQHIYCKAVDIQVEGVSKWDLAKFLRTIPGRGGVGTYCRTKSVHLDIGSKRDWHHPCRRSSKRKKKA